MLYTLLLDAYEFFNNRRSLLFVGQIVKTQIKNCNKKTEPDDTF